MSPGIPALLDEFLGTRGRARRVGAADDIEQPFDRELFLRDFATVARRTRHAPLDLAPDELARLRAAGVDWPITPWTLDDLARASLVLAAGARLDDVAFERLVGDLYDHGDNHERAAVLRVLALLPDPVRFLDIAVGACRLHIQPLFEAIACENPYPGRYFPELNFNQMVLKALFTGVPLARIVGLDDRITPELVRMADAYASERAAAGRSIPEDIGRIAAVRGNP